MTDLAFSLHKHSLTLMTAEPKDDPCRKPHVILFCRSAVDTRKARQQIFGLNKTNCHVGSKSNVNAATSGHGKSILACIDTAGACVQPTATEQ